MAFTASSKHNPETQISDRDGLRAVEYVTMVDENPKASSKLSRRETLTLLESNVLSATAPISLSSSGCDIEPRQVDVVIVGAGFAGMTVARQLLRKENKVAALEARERVGGRRNAQDCRSACGCGWNGGWSNGSGEHVATEVFSTSHRPS